MARVYTFLKFFDFFLYFSIALCCYTSSVSASVDLDDDNWREILEGEWMVEFYAPWCPACHALAPAWTELTNRSIRKGLGVNTGAVDVTQSPGLSGRFVVTALPTIFHVINGEFRQYKGPRDADAMLGYIEEQRWKQTEPIPGWKAPHSFQMSLVAEFFKLSQALRNIHNMLMETYGMPTWGSYLIFALVTIFIGAILGLILVCIIDLLYPPRRSERVFVSRAELDARARGDHGDKSDDDQELINDDIVDDAETLTETLSDAEKHSPSDTSDDDIEKITEAGGDGKDNGTEDKPTEVRKRRPRKAD